MARWVRWSLAFVFFVIGVIGVLVPVMPQALFFVVSAMLLAADLPPARRFVHWMFRKWPKLRRAVPKRFRVELRKAPRK